MSVIDWLKKIFAAVAGCGPAIDRTQETILAAVAQNNSQAAALAQALHEHIAALESKQEADHQALIAALAAVTKALGDPTDSPGPAVSIDLIPKEES